MYSEDINKICDVCVYSKKVKGTVEHLMCERGEGYVPLTHSCNGFKYDIMKKRVRRRPPFEHTFTADDFKL